MTRNVVCIAGFVCCASTIACGGSDADQVVGIRVDGLTSRLPSPRVKRGPIRSQIQQRVDEVEALLIRRYAGYRIVETTQTYAGDIVDWVDSKTIPGSDLEQPPVPTETPVDDVQAALTELQAHPELQGPPGTVAVVRPQFLPYAMGSVDAESLDAFISQQELGQPSAQNRLYAGRSLILDNKGGYGWFNTWSIGTLESSTFSVTELIVACPSGSSSQLVGIALSRDLYNFGDSTLRVQVEFRGTSGGGAWVPHLPGFVQTGSFSPGTVVGDLSTAGGTQYQLMFELQLYQGNWWVGMTTGLGFEWMGYFPGNLFNAINTKACKIHWYGEVFDPTPTSWTANNMGSGQFASQGYGYAAFVRVPVYFDLNVVPQWLSGTQVPSPQDALCYTKSDLFSSSTPGWERYFYLGGPGGDAPGCD